MFLKQFAKFVKDHDKNRFVVVTDPQSGNGRQRHEEFFVEDPSRFDVLVSSVQNVPGQHQVTDGIGNINDGGDDERIDGRHFLQESFDEESDQKNAAANEKIGAAVAVFQKIIFEFLRFSRLFHHRNVRIDAGSNALDPLFQMSDQFGVGGLDDEPGRSEIDDDEFVAESPFGDPFDLGSADRAVQVFQNQDFSERRFDLPLLDFHRIVNFSDDGDDGMSLFFRVASGREIDGQKMGFFIKLENAFILVRKIKFDFSKGVLAVRVIQIELFSKILHHDQMCEA